MPYPVVVDGNPENVTRETLFDLASVSKVLAVNYAAQKFLTEGRLDVDAKIFDIPGAEYLNATIKAPLISYIPA